MRRSEAVCPFCGASIALEATARLRIVSEPMSRSVMYAIGPALVVGAASFLEACSSGAYGAPPRDADLAHHDAARTDASAASTDAATPDDAGDAP